MGEPVRSNATRLVIEKAMKDLPALPTVVTRIMEVTNNGTASAAELERLISSDRGMWRRSAGGTAHQREQECDKRASGSSHE